MSIANIIDGKRISADIKKDLALEVAALKNRGIVPCLAVILVGENPASVSYVTGKRKALAELGIEDRTVLLPESTTEYELLQIIRDLNSDDSVNGILVQLPLPKHIDEDKVIGWIDPAKDVDGFTPINVGNMVIGKDCFLPCTPHGIIQMLKRTGIETAGKRAVVVGRSNIVGKPISILLSSKDINCTVTMCHTGTKNLEEFTRQADILVVASGRPNTITADMIKEGAVVIDVGVNRIPDATKKSGFRLVGDCDFEGMKDKAGYITPVPGGVGPMTITMLMWNTVEAAKRKL